MNLTNRPYVCGAYSCRFEKRRQNHAWGIMTPDHAQLYRGRESIHWFVDNTSSGNILQRGGHQRHAYTTGDEADDGLHEPDVLLHRNWGESRLAACVGDLPVQSGHLLIARGENKRFLR